MSYAKFGCCYIDISEPVEVFIFVFCNSSEVVVFVAVYKIRVTECACGNQTGNFSFDETFGFSGVLSLVTDSYFVIFLQQFCNIRINGFCRYTCHGNAPEGTSFSACKGNFQIFCNCYGIFKKGFKKVTHAIKKNHILIF